MTLKSAGLALAIGVLVALALLSVALGARPVPLHAVVEALTSSGAGDDVTVVRELRLPRTVLGIGVGACLGLAGALMQSLTRNPLADPGLLGVSEGAAAGVVAAIGLLGVTDPAGYVWFAFAGAALASVVVYLLGSSGRSGAGPVRLALAGIAVAAALRAFSDMVLRADTAAYDRMRFWLTGSLAAQTADVTVRLAPLAIAGILLGLALARPLNALALGDDTGRALGAGLGRTRILAAVAITLLCGAATAAAGPIWFVGLAVPHIVRGFTGPDQRWILPYSAVLAPVLILASDITGRLIARPGEVQVGIVCAVLGAPAFIVLARRRRLSAL
ncbi:iron chelate uptake ABC transporter family permease subunit [Streptosporangiaceae bacterium NEAU-GS5]|nr:iron chelate uptake ABC transporter family permease subunit [Streptosporangiaceae bacterium NEAU-GS5]